MIGKIKSRIDYYYDLGYTKLLLRMKQESYEKLRDECLSLNSLLVELPQNCPIFMGVPIDIDDSIAVDWYITEAV